MASSKLAGTKQACTLLKRGDDCSRIPVGKQRDAIILNGSGSLWTMGQRQQAGGTAHRGGGRCTQRLPVRFGRRWSFRRRFPNSMKGATVCRSAGVGFLLDAHQVLIGDLPAKVFVLSALLKVLFEKDGTAGIGDESAGGRQENITGAILHLHATP